MDREMYLLYNFQPMIYNKVENKKILFNKSGEIISELMGIPTPKVFLISEKKQEKIPECRGFYIYEEYSVFINDSKYKNPYILLETLIHEIAHLFLRFIIKHKIYQENINELKFNKYKRITGLNEKCYRNFKNIFYSFEITKRYQNLVQLDGFYNRKNLSQPYYYNTDSSEIFAECVAIFLLNKLLSSKDKIKIDKTYFEEFIQELNYSKNEMPELKDIYLEENVKDKTLLKMLMKIIMSIRNKSNFLTVSSFDIQQYDNLWKMYKRELNILKSAISS